MKFLNILSGGMTLLFLVWTYYQLNDVDGEAPIWVLAYGATAVLSALYMFNKVSLAPVAIVAGLFVVWALVWISRIQLQSSIFGVDAWMQNEYLRESGGLVVMIVWLGVLSLVLYRRSRG
ncbi:MAG: transmembrane 220 family protein [Rhodothermales bacterium]